MMILRYLVILYFTVIVWIPSSCFQPERRRASTTTNTVLLRRLAQQQRQQNQQDEEQQQEGQPQPAPKRLDRGMNFLAQNRLPIPQGLIVTIVAEGWKFVWKRFMAELAPQDETGGYQRPSYRTTAGTTRATSTIRLQDDDDTTTTGRYRLYTGNPCPWCHRTLLAYQYLRLDRSDGIISHVALLDNPRKASRGGWVLPTADENGNVDLQQVYDYYNNDDTNATTDLRCTAPLLVDTKTKQFISNESADIIRFFNTFADGDLIPIHLIPQIETMNEWIYQSINNGVYRCGFATTQYAYDLASRDVRDGLNRIETILTETTNTYLLGPNFTEPDLRLLPTILRFDGVYGPLFRAGGSHVRIRSDYPAIHAWLQRCWSNIPAVRTSIDLADASASYYRQLFPLNPSGIIPTPITARDLGLSEK